MRGMHKAFGKEALDFFECICVDILPLFMFLKSLYIRV